LQYWGALCCGLTNTQLVHIHSLTHSLTNDDAHPQHQSACACSLNSVFSIFSTNSFFSVNCTLGYFQICGGDDGRYIAIGLAFMAVAVMAFGLISITAEDRRVKRAACKNAKDGQPLLTCSLSNKEIEMQLA
jgi:hypothetical protein